MASSGTHARAWHARARGGAATGAKAKAVPTSASMTPPPPQEVLGKVSYQRNGSYEMMTRTLLLTTALLKPRPVSARRTRQHLAADASLRRHTDALLPSDGGCLIVGRLVHEALSLPLMRPLRRRLGYLWQRDAAPHRAHATARRSQWSLLCVRGRLLAARCRCEALGRGADLGTETPPPRRVSSIVGSENGSEITFFGH